MGLLFADSEKKVAETLTIVQLMQKHDAEMEHQKNETRKALRRNQKLLDENKKFRNAKYKLKQNIRKLTENIEKEPTAEKRMKLKVYQNILEELK